MVEDSRKKREDFLDKLTSNTSLLKGTRSKSKLNRMSRSRTPKHIPYV